MGATQQQNMLLAWLPSRLRSRGSGIASAARIAGTVLRCFDTVLRCFGFDLCLHTKAMMTMGIDHAVLNL